MIPERLVETDVAMKRLLLLWLQNFLLLLLYAIAELLYFVLPFEEQVGVLQAKNMELIVIGLNPQLVFLHLNTFNLVEQQGEEGLAIT